MAELSPGAVFAGHRIEGVAGRGGMGVVYRAMHLALDHEVALKVIAAEISADDTFRARFRDEARSAASIRHPNVVSVRHAGEEDGMWFVTMDLIDGMDLRRILRAEGALEPERAVAIIEQVAAALDAAHRRGLVHRDVKPGNILIERLDGTEHAYLTDFGLTKRVEETSGLTRTGAFVGTIDYCAPEQIQRGEITPRTDIYALGCVLFELLTGLTPFGRIEEDVAKIYAHLQREPPSVGEVASGVPAAFDAVIGRALAKSPEDRFASAPGLAAAARQALEPAGGESTVEHTPTFEAPFEPAAEQEAPTVVTAEPRRRRGRRGLAGIAIVAAVAGAVAAALLAGGGSEDGGPDRAIVGERFDAPGFPVGVAFAAGEVWVGARKGGEVLHGEPGSEDLASVDVGALSPEGMDVEGGTVWMASSRPAAVVPINAANNRPGNRIGTEGALRGLAVADGVVYVADHDDGELVRFADGEEPVAVSVGEGPNGVAAGEGAIWVTNRDSGTVSRLAPLGDDVEATIEVGAQPKGLVVAEGFVWVANTDSDSVSVIDPDANDVDAVIDVGSDPRDVAFGEGSIWVANGELRANGDPTMRGTVSRVDPEAREVIETIVVDGSPEDITVGAGHVWVALGAGNELVRIDP